MNSIKFPNTELVEQDAAQWIAKVDRGLKPNEEIELSQWLEASPVHGETLIKCASMWDLLDVLSPIAKLMPVEKLKLNDQDGTKAEFVAERYASNRLTKSSKSYLVLIAASLILAIGTFIMSPLVTQKASTPQEYVAVSETKVPVKSYKTAVGELSRVALSDGSVLQLNTDSEVNVAFSDSVRQVELVSGEVYFEVAKDPKKPFVVDVGDDKVAAIGTAFNIDSRPGLDTEVLVTEGKVRVSLNSLAQSESDELFLIQGQKVVIGSSESKVNDDQDHETILSWREGMLVFQGEPLAQAIQEIDRYTSLKLTIVDDSIADIPVGGFFRTGDTEGLLQILSLNFGVGSKQIGDEILLYKTRTE